MDLRRNDVLDEITERYKESFFGLTNQVDEIGHETHAILIKKYVDGLKKDLKKADFIIEKGDKFNKKKIKHEYKLDKIGFEELSNDDFMQLSFFSRLKYRKKRRKFNRVMRKWIKVLRKFKPYIPASEFYAEEPEEETQELPPTEDTGVDVVEELPEEREPDQADTDLSALIEDAEAQTVQEEENASADSPTDCLEEFFADEDFEETEQ